MYKYQKGINTKDSSRQVEYSISNGVDACLCMCANMEARRPYNGLYIKNGKVILENLIEKIEINDKVYKMVELKTAIKNLSCSEYISSIDLENNTIEYDISSLKYSKTITFSKKYKVLYVEYNIKNKGENKALFKVLPMITNRSLFTMKTSKLIGFNQRSLNDGVIINLNIMNNENLVLKSKEFSWTNSPVFLNNVKHEYINEQNQKEIYTEDLMLPGEFEVEISPLEERKLKLVISAEEKNLSKIDTEYIVNEYIAENKIITESINENFVELRELAKSINNLVFRESIVSSLPYIKDYNELTLKLEHNKNNVKELIDDFSHFIDILKSLDGQYLSFNKTNKVNTILLKIRRYIKNIEALCIDDERFIEKFLELKLWYVESVSRLSQRENNTKLYFDIVKDIVYDSVDNKDLLAQKIKYVALMYNAIKVYEKMLKDVCEEDIKIREIIEYLDNLILDKFWDENLRVLKKDLNEEDIYVNVDMLYTLSLSYSCINNDISFKVLDSIFKELYTPYGLREFSKHSKYNNGLIYPKYMAHFVKANLKQNGITHASQKIAYNMVKELFMDIGKYVNGGVKKIYHEKGHMIDSLGYDLLTNAEIIRLYNMLT